MTLSLDPIGIIHSPFTELSGMPIQPAGARDVEGRLVLRPEFAPGLADLDGFSRCILIYHFHHSDGFKLAVKPFMDTVERGLFSTRAPRRPNPIGLSIVEVLRVTDAEVAIRGVDVLDGTPLLDIKPYVPRFDAHPDAQSGWLEANAAKADSMKSDSRFTGSGQRDEG